MDRYHGGTIETPPETRAMTLRVPAPLHDQIRQVAERHDRSLTAEIRTALREHLERSTDRATRSEDRC